MHKGWRGRYLSRMTESVTRSHKPRPEAEGRPRLFPYGLIDAQPVSQKANLLRLAKKPRLPTVAGKAPEADAPVKHASWFYVKK